MKKVYQKRKKSLEYCIVEEGTRGKRLGLRNKSHIMILRENDPTQSSIS